LALKVPKEVLDLKVCKVIQGLKGLKGLTVHRALLVPKARKVPKGLQGHKVVKALKGS
jgi:hypothetical protein